MSEMAGVEVSPVAEEDTVCREKTGSWTIAGEPRCMCGWRPEHRWGGTAREELRVHLAQSPVLP